MEKIADRIHKLYVNLQYIRKNPKPQELQICVERLLSDESLFLKYISPQGGFEDKLNVYSHTC